MPALGRPGRGGAPLDALDGKGNRALEQLLRLLLHERASVVCDLLHVDGVVEAQLELLAVHREHLTGAVEPGSERRLGHPAAFVELPEEAILAGLISGVAAAALRPALGPLTGAGRLPVRAGAGGRGGGGGLGRTEHGGRAGDLEGNGAAGVAAEVRAGELGHGGRQEADLGGAVAGGAEQALPQGVDGLAGEASHVDAVSGNVAGDLEGGAEVALGEGPGELLRALVADEAEGLEHVVGAGRGTVHGGDLLKQGDGVAEGAAGLAGDGQKALIGDAEALLLGDETQARDHRLDGDAAEVKALAAGGDGGGDLVQLRRGEDENGVRRGFFERLQEGVEGARGEHVHLVEEVDLPFEVAGGEGDLVAQLAHVVDAAVAGGVHLDEVEGGAAVDGLAGAAGVAGLTVGKVTAVDGLGEDAGGGGLAGAAGAGEEVRVGDLVGGEGVAKGRDDVVLTDHLVKATWAPLAVEHRPSRTPNSSVVWRV